MPGIPISPGSPGSPGIPISPGSPGSPGVPGAPGAPTGPTPGSGIMLAKSAWNNWLNKLVDCERLNTLLFMNSTISASVLLFCEATLAMAAGKTALNSELPLSTNVL